MLSATKRRAIAARALTIYERAARVRTGAPAAPDGIAPTAARILGTWNQAFAPGDSNAFFRRLAWDGLNADVIAAAVAEAEPSDEPPEVAEPAGIDDRWTEWLARFADAAGTVLRDVVVSALPEEALFATEREPPFLELWIAPLRAARRELGALPAAALGPEAIHALERQLVRELAVYGALAAYESFRAFCRTTEADVPYDAASSGLYREFVIDTLNEQFSTMMTSYPVLARQLARVTDTWTASTKELADRIASDRSALADAFNEGADLGEVVNVIPGLSDPHAGRRRVAILEFAGGTRIVYKPRDLNVDRAFAALLDWFAAHGLEPRPTAPRVLPCGGYGWVEHVEQQLFPHVESVKRYYRQAGALVFVTHLLGSKDLHMENLVATAAGPILVDLEMLLQPVAHVTAPSEAPHNATVETVTESCLRTGLLSLVEIGANDQPYDMGGLRGTGTTAAPPGRTWVNLRSDALTVLDEAASPAPVKNAVRTAEGLQRAEHYHDDIMAGFTAAYRIALAHRGELLARGGPLSAFAATTVRVIARPTNQYGLLSSTRNVPRYQRDATAHSIIVDALHRPLKDSALRPREWPLVVEERRVTDALDVPRFVVPADGHTLYSDEHPILDEYFAVSALDAVRDRVSRLSEFDLAAQRRTLSRAVRQSTASRFILAPPRDEGTELPASVDDSVLIAHAKWIGNELLARAIRHDGTRLTWEGSDSERLDSYYLYNGAIGPGLFLAALAAVTADRDWRASALAALTPVVDFVEDASFPTRAAEAPIGGCAGLGSIVHGLARAGDLLGDERLLAAARRTAALIDAARIASDRSFDVVDGAAGGLLSLLALHDISPDPAILAAAAACGDHLIATHVERGRGWAWPSPSGQHLAGYAHGSAGIAAALARLYRATSRSGYRDAASRAFDFVTGLFSHPDRNWPVAEPDPGNVVTIIGKMNAWCHGAPGILVAAASAVEPGPEPAIVAQARGALDTVERWNPVQADHLCCGHLGRADALLTGAAGLAIDNARARAQAVAGRVLARARAQQHVRLSTPGVEYIVFAPGFFRGVSGIGYQLLRLADPEKVKSVLFFGLDQRP